VRYDERERGMDGNRIRVCGGGTWGRGGGNGSGKVDLK